MILDDYYFRSIKDRLLEESPELSKVMSILNGLPDDDLTGVAGCALEDVGFEKLSYPEVLGHKNQKMSLVLLTLLLGVHEERKTEQYLKAKRILEEKGTAQ